MRFTKSPDYTYFSILRTSSILQNYYNTPSTNILKVIITEVTCSANGSELVIPHSAVTPYDYMMLGEIDYYIEVKASDIISPTTVYPDGVYSIRLELLDSGQQLLNFEEGCMLIDFQLSDLVYSYQAQNLTSNAYFFYLATKAGEYCTTCDCQRMCNLYNETLNQIGL